MTVRTPARYDYRSTLRAKHMRTIPVYDKLRTKREPNDVELAPIKGLIKW
jgi:hypothetical protein